MTAPSRPAFRVDTSVCSGCKACQIACQDRNGLEAGRLWRRVYEVAGGDWHSEGAAWRPDIFAYNLSLSCNHCEAPICAEVCPSGAMHTREDGLVLLNEDACLGCGYCGWACPYGAPQLRADAGVMSKCTFCVEDLDEGRAPACVSACPVRALDFESGMPQEAPPRIDPLPDPELTRPALVLKAHADAGRAHDRDLDIEPGLPHGLREWSLVLFTLLVQMAVGLSVGLGLVRPWLGPVAGTAGQILVPSLTLVAMAVSALHLGRPRNMIRAVANLRWSWLSREILLAVGFLGLGLWAVVTDAVLVRQWLLPVSGVGLLVGMSRVYMLRTVPVWNRVRTQVGFGVTGFLPGLILPAVPLLMEKGAVAGWAASSVWTVGLGLAIWQRSRFYGAYVRRGV